MMSRLRTSILVFAFVTGFYVGSAEGAAAATQSGSLDGTERSPTTAEFPPGDAQVWTRQREGLLEKRASRALKDAPDHPSTIGILLERDRLSDTVVLLERVVETSPERMAPTLESLLPHLYRFRSDRYRPLGSRLRVVAAAAERYLGRLPREEAARLARQLAVFDVFLDPGKNDEIPLRLRAFLAAYPTTEAALLAEVDLLGAGRVSQQQLDALDRFARDHPGTVAGAKALYQKGFQLSVNMTLAGLASSNDDPTARLLQVFDVVRELESGRYPTCEWVEKAPSLVIQFFAPTPNYAPENIDRVIAAYLAIVKSGFLDPHNPAESGVGYVLVHKVGEVLERRSDGLARMEPVFADLERDHSDPSAFRYLRALFYFKHALKASGPDRSDLLERGMKTLAGLAQERAGLYSRKALATLASRTFDDGRYADARDLYQQYLVRYPDTAWAWVAALRVGQCHEQLLEWSAARDAYKKAASNYPEAPLARVLGRTYAARASDALGNFDVALGDYQEALDGWDDDYGTSYSIFMSRAARSTGSGLLADGAEVRKHALPDRIAQLTRAQGLPGGALLESGRWHLARGELENTKISLQRFLAGRAPAAVVLEARALLHRAVVMSALASTNVESARADDGGALKELESLAGAPYTFGVSAAKIATAFILGNRGAVEHAEAELRRALTEWQTHQATTAVGSARPGLEKDVVEIRNVVFRPQGGEIFSGTRWNAFEWPVRASPFVGVNPEIVVRLSKGESVRMWVRERFPGMDNVLFLDDDGAALVEQVMTTLGGTRKRQPTGIMETPNQPVGRSQGLLALLNTFLPVRPGHWGGWVFTTYPIVSSIEFTNAERTAAFARVTVGYAGASVVLHKADGGWIAQALVDFWVT